MDGGRVLSGAGRVAESPHLSPANITSIESQLREREQEFTQRTAARRTVPEPTPKQTQPDEALIQETLRDAAQSLAYRRSREGQAERTIELLGEIRDLLRERR